MYTPFFQSEEYAVLEQAYNRTDPPLSEEWKVYFLQIMQKEDLHVAFQGYIVMAHAVIDKFSAWDEAMQLERYIEFTQRS